MQSLRGRLSGGEKQRDSEERYGRFFKRTATGVAGTGETAAPAIGDKIRKPNLEGTKRTNSLFSGDRKSPSSRCWEVGLEL